MAKKSTSRKPARAAKQTEVERPLSDFVSISGRYRRSIHIERDELSTDALDGYRVTPVALRTLSRIFAGIENTEGNRAWSLTGPYGSGKSSFAMFLAALFAADVNKEPRSTARKLLKAASDEHSRELLGDSGRKTLPALCSVLITGERQPLSTLLLRGLAKGLERIFDGGRKSKSKALLQILAQAQSSSTPSTSIVVQAFADAIDLLTTKSSAKGLLVVLDEAGKALEYAAQNPSEADILLLQELAELAARSGDTPFVFITVFHQAFAGYATRLGPTQRNEWEKVQGRFEDIPFFDGWDQTLRLLADAIELHPPDPRPVKNAYNRISKALESVDLPPVLEPKQTEALLQASLPLHPYVALLLGPLFRSGVFQNERSLFAFLASQEPAGLQEFIAGRTVKKKLSLYPLDRLYDYIENVLQSRASFARPHALRIAEVALQRVPDEAGKLGAKLVKNIALLSWLGEKVGLRADEATLAASVVTTAKAAEVHTCLEALCQASVITYRRFRSSYVVWEGSDIRIDEVIADAGQLRISNERAAAMLDILSPVDPLVARRHLFRTGTLRYFPVQFVAAEKLRATLDKPDASSGDGNVCIVLFHSEDQRKAIIETIEEELRIESAPPRPVLCVVPRDPWRLLDLLGEYAALEKLVRDDPRLPHDPVAKREIQARKLDLEGLVQSEVSKLIGHDEAGSSASWHLNRQTYSVGSARQLSALVSDICDQVFHLAPIIHNELLNRGDLSSAAASARRNLLAAMIAKPNEDMFGIEGFPPEKSMYLSLYRSPHLLHGKVRGQWTLKDPPKNSTREGSVGPAWHALRSFLDSNSDRRLPLEQLYELLESPPYGIKRGVIPVLFVHFLAINAASLALYENDAFLPKVTEAVIERLLKSAKNFLIQWYPMGDTRIEVLRSMGEALQVSPRPGLDTPTVLQLVKRLVRITSDLPRYAQITKRLSPQTVRLREALLQAKEPAPLIFKHLPVALGHEPFKANACERSDVADFARHLADAVNEFANAYETLLGDLEAEIAKHFGMADLRDAALQRELGQRGARVFPHAIAPKLRAFLIRLVDEQMPRTEWLVSIGTLLAKKPPEHWADPDFDVFRTELALVRRSFGEMEALTLADEQLDSNPDSQRRLFRVAVSELGAPVRERVVSLSPAEAQCARNLQGELERTIKGAGSELTLDARLAILSALTASLIREAERETSATDPASRDHD
ncbi:MAG: hypothetical protein KC431_23205 [Myxococcales bacterium]|nr:hypothetical protein [Myxococcales bacterium]